jgi:E3 ubiquitin-protein ligase TRIP12
MPEPREPDSVPLGLDASICPFPPIPPLQVRARCLKVLLQILVACPAAQLREALRDLPLAAFLASLLAARDTATLAAALHCCELLMLQLPDVFKHVFLKEGVAHAVEQIAASASAAGTGPAAGGGSPPPALSASPIGSRGAAAAGPAAPAEETRRGQRAPRERSER